MADDFEKAFELKFPLIRKRTGAFLFFLYPPMRCIGTRGTMPIFVQTGRALFDVAGWLPIEGDYYSNTVNKKGEQNPSLPNDRLAAVFIGVELKRNKEPHSSMRIVGEDGSGSGIQAHQLEALAAVHRDGGIARILWNNGGVIGILSGDQIAQAHFTYGVSVQAEKMRKTPAKGARSIPWGNFVQVDFTATPEKIILPDIVEPTLAKTLAKKRKDAARKIEKASKTEAPSQLMEDMAEELIDEELAEAMEGFPEP